MSFDAHSDGLVGGTQQQGFNPSQAPLSQRAFTLANDPFAGADFNACITQATAAAQFSSGNALTAGNVGTAGIDSISDAGFGGSLAEGLLGAGSSAAIAFFGNGQACTGPDPQVPTVPSDCTQFTTGGEGFSEAKFQLLLNQEQLAQNDARCKLNNAQQAKASAQCFGDEFQHLKDAMAQVKKDFDANIQAMQQYETTVNQAIEAEQQKQTALDGKIKSIGDTLTQVQGVLNSVLGNGGGGGQGGQQGGGGLNGLATSVAQQKDALSSFEHDQKAFRANSTQSCIDGTGASSSGIHNCPNANGDLLSPKDCVLSIFRDSAALKLSGGSTRISPADAHKADFQRKTFQNRLEQMLGDLSGTDPRVSNFDEFQARYGSELNSFGNAGAQLLQELKACDTDVQNDLKRKLADKNDPQFGKRASDLRDATTQISGNATQMVNQLDGAIRDAGREVFGQELNELVDGAACNNAATSSNSGGTNLSPVALDQQLKCAQGLAANLQALINGTPPPGARTPVEVPLNVPGLDGNPARCKGLRDCLNVAGQLKATSVTRMSQMQGNGTFPDSRCPGGCPGLKKFHTDSNRAIQQAAQQAADLFQRRVSIAKAELAQVKNVFRNANISFPVKDQTTANGRVEDICPQSDAQLCAPLPADFGDKLASVAGVPNIDPGAFEDMESKANDKAGTEQTNLSSRTNDINSLQALKQKCIDQARRQRLARDVGRKRRQLQDAISHCTSDVRNHAGHATVDSDRSNIEHLSADLTDICDADEGSTGGDSGASSPCDSLSSGTSSDDQCGTVLADQQQKDMDSLNTCLNGSVPGASGQAATPNSIQTCLDRRNAVRNAVLQAQ